MNRRTLQWLHWTLETEKEDREIEVSGMNPQRRKRIEGSFLRAGNLRLNKAKRERGRAVS